MSKTMSLPSKAHIKKAITIRLLKFLDQLTPIAAVIFFFCSIIAGFAYKPFNFGFVIALLFTGSTFALCMFSKGYRSK